MSHMYPEGAPAGFEDQSKPETVGHCLICGEEITEGTSYVTHVDGVTCSDPDCMIETIHALGQKVRNLQ